MKKKMILYVVMVCMILTSACGTEVPEMEEKETEQIQNRVLPELSAIKEICDLATLECHYHNVAKSVKEKGEGVFHIGERERKFWIEYEGIATIKFDLSKIRMNVEGNTIYITLPEPKVECGIVEGSWDESSYVIEEDVKLGNKNPISAENQRSAVENAQNEMLHEIESNSSLLNAAKSQARTLIQNYVDEIGRLTGEIYAVEWEYLDV